MRKSCARPVLSVGVVSTACVQLYQVRLSLRINPSFVHRLWVSCRVSYARFWHTLPSVIFGLYPLSPGLIRTKTKYLNHLGVMS